MENIYPCTCLKILFSGQLIGQIEEKIKLEMQIIDTISTFIQLTDFSSMNYRVIFISNIVNNFFFLPK